jgi:hypothetical protein
MNATTSRITIRECTNATELYRHYDGQSEPQPAYIALDLEDGTMWADYNAEIGNAVPESVRHGRVRRYGIPLLTADAANRVMAALLPLAERIVAGADIDWNGHNMASIFNGDATAAEDELERLLGIGMDERGGGPQVFDPAGDTITVWDIDGAVNGQEAEEYGITADTSDERLDEIEQKILSDLRECGEGSNTVVCAGLDTYLRQLRTDAAADSDD